MNTHVSLIDLADYLARSIFFESMANGKDRPQRIAFKGGKYPDNETDLGGLCLSYLRNRIEEALKKRPRFIPGNDIFSEESLSTFQEEVHQWSVKTFPLQTPESKIAHLFKEVKELAANPTDASEMADILILICGIAEMADVDLLTAARIKMEINRARQWGEVQPDGTQSHIEPTIS